jgi:type II secretory ATPase GspE/PulE/Tfp pilus assembly ATPase PilB-like protein
MAIIEAMTITDQIRKLIIARASTREMGKVAIGQGHAHAAHGGKLDRARDGISTLEQVLNAVASRGSAKPLSFWSEPSLLSPFV